MTGKMDSTPSWRCLYQKKCLSKWAATRLYVGQICVNWWKLNPVLLIGHPISRLNLTMSSLHCSSLLALLSSLSRFNWVAPSAAPLKILALWVPFFYLPLKNYSFRIKTCDCIYKQEASTAKYIVQQYVAATGGPAAYNTVSSMYALGQVKMRGSEMQQGDDSVHARGNCEAGGFVLWQKNPDLWCLELVVAGFKVSAGSNGKVAWNQSSCQPNHAHRGPARPLRRFFQVNCLLYTLWFCPFDKPYMNWGSRDEYECSWI